MQKQKTEQRPVSFFKIDSEQAGRRLDKFLVSHLFNVPRTRIYQMIRKGEVRLNKGRVKQNYRLQIDDMIRIPPVYIVHQENINQSPAKLQPHTDLTALINNSILYEDQDFMVLNKPANIPVHGGSNVRFSVIDILRAQRGEENFLELVHRLDKATSGCLLIAKNHQTLRHMHSIFRNNAAKKEYFGLLQGHMVPAEQKVNLPLSNKKMLSNKELPALTYFYLLKHFTHTSLVRIEPITGRKHQIRLHANAIGHPLVGDQKYGNYTFNRTAQKSGIKRLFLHAQKISFTLYTGKYFTITAPLTHDLNQYLDTLT